MSRVVGLLETQASLFYFGKFVCMLKLINSSRSEEGEGYQLCGAANFVHHV